MQVLFDQATMAANDEREKMYLLKSILPLSSIHKSN